MKNKLKTGIALFLCVCVGIIAYVQFDRYQTEKKVESEIKAQNEQIIKNIDDHQKQGNPLKNREKGRL